MKKIKILLTILCVFTINAAYAANSAPWPTMQSIGTNSSPYFYYFEGDTVRTALIKVAQSFDVKVHFSDDIAEDTLNQKLSGRFKVFSPVELFNKFSNMYAFTWFYYGGVLYIAPNNFVTKNLYVAPEMVSNFKNILNNDGLLDERFGWSEIPSEGMIVVSGPQDYVNLIAKRMKKLNIAPVDQQFAIFRLKYASAVDTTIQLNSSQIVIPGVATILKAMLQGAGNTGSSVDSKLLQQVVEPLKNNLKAVMPNSNLDGDGAVQASGGGDQSQGGGGNRSPASVSAPVIQADARLNTIIIRDKSNNMSVYKALIDLLDVPAPLIQVQVMILDIDQVRMNEAGINWWGNNAGGISGGFGANNLQNSSQPGSPTLTASFGSISPGNLIVNNLKSFMAGLRFMENKGYAKAQSKTAVVTIDNIPAVVNLTESFYTTNAQNQQGTPIQTQTQMQVTPHVIYDASDRRRVKLTVALQDGNVEERTVNGMPATLQGDLNSQAIVEEGSSLLLAGFSHKQTEQVESKVPILGDIPILGWLFKDKSTSNRSLQRSYLVTPTIIWSDRNDKVPNYSLLNKGGTQQQQQQQQNNRNDD